MCCSEVRLIRYITVGGNVYGDKLTAYRHIPVYLTLKIQKV